jgi:alpha-tubulin suppressor-like RCC1 family protein
MSKPNQFLSPEGDLEDYFVDEYWLIDQYVGDQLWTWGRSNYGQLGNAVTTNVSTPVTTFAGGTNWKQVASGLLHTAAIKTDGTLWTWGRSNYGQLGNAVTTNVSTPVTTFAGGTNWKQVSSGGAHTAAIKTDGTLWTWGLGTNGQLGNVTIASASTPVTTFSGGTNWKQVTCGGYHTAAIKTDGTLWTWGYARFGRLGNASTTNVSTPVTTFAGGTNWKQVSAANAHTAAIKTDGTLWTWGLGTFGRLGNASTTNVSTPVTTFAGGTNWKQVTCGGYHTAAIKTDGTLWSWGYGSYGRLGNASTTNTNVSTPVTTFAGGTNWKQVSSGGAHTAAIKTDGTLWTWGVGDTFGRLGNASTTNVSTPVTTFAGGTNWKQVSSGGAHTAAVQAGINAEYPLS